MSAFVRPPVFHPSLIVGPGTEVVASELRAEALGPPEPGDDYHGPTQRMRITANLTVSAEVNVVAGKCAVCGRLAPPLDQQTMWSVLENHQGKRLVFPRGAMDGESDCYRLPGWHDIDGRLTCDECAAALEAAKAAVKRQRGAKR